MRGSFAAFNARRFTLANAQRLNNDWEQSSEIVVLLTKHSLEAHMCCCWMLRCFVVTCLFDRISVGWKRRLLNNSFHNSGYFKIFMLMLKHSLARQIYICRFTEEFLGSFSSIIDYIKLQTWHQAMFGLELFWSTEEALIVIFITEWHQENCENFLHWRTWNEIMDTWIERFDRTLPQISYARSNSLLGSFQILHVVLKTRFRPLPPLLLPSP